MGRPTINFGNHFVNWSPETNSITIRPQYRNSTTTDRFGLGNAVISLNLSDLPTEGIIMPITGDSSGQGLLPMSPFKLKRWYGMPEGMNMSPPLSLQGFNGWVHGFSYTRATGGSIKEVTSVQIIQNGYGCEEIVDAQRLEW